MKLHTIFGLAAAPLLLLAAPTAAATRNYDCSKAGNANKTVCKTAAAKPAVKTPAPKPSKAKVVAAAPPQARNYDCPKPGNPNKAACKAAAAPAPSARSTPARAAPPAANGTGSQGATSKCRDNTYSQSRDHRGACSHHGGVATWY